MKGAVAFGAMVRGQHTGESLSAQKYPCNLSNSAFTTSASRGGMGRTFESRDAGKSSDQSNSNSSFEFAPHCCTFLKPVHDVGIHFVEVRLKLYEFKTEM